MFLGTEEQKHVVRPSVVPEMINPLHFPSNRRRARGRRFRRSPVTRHASEVYINWGGTPHFFSPHSHRILCCPALAPYEDSRIASFPAFSTPFPLAEERFQADFFGCLALGPWVPILKEWGGIHESAAVSLYTADSLCACPARVKGVSR